MDLGWGLKSIKAGINAIPMGIIAVMCAALTEGCDNVQENDGVTVEGIPFRFPRSHVDVFSPRKGYRFYVRLVPPNEKFVIILDGRTLREEKKTGKMVVSTINLHTIRKLRTFTINDQAVICKDTPLLSCGFTVYKNEYIFSVLFNEDQILNSSTIKSRALEILDTYKVSQ